MIEAWPKLHEAMKKMDIEKRKELTLYFNWYVDCLFGKDDFGDILEGHHWDWKSRLTFIDAED